MEFNATIIVVFISFIIFIVIMNAVLYKPINDIIEQRKKYIDDNYNVAQENFAKKEALIADREEKIAKARFDAKEKSSNIIEAAKSKRNKLVQDAKENSKAEIEQNVQEKNIQSEQVKQDLKDEVVNLAQIISDKFIESSNKVEADYEIIENIMQG